MEKSAAAKGRTLTAEINIRLRESQKTESLFMFGRELEPLNSAGYAVREPNAHLMRAKFDLDPSEAILVSAFRKLPAEKQLALISLLK